MQYINNDVGDDINKYSNKIPHLQLFVLPEAFLLDKTILVFLFEYIILFQSNQIASERIYHVAIFS